ncbi:hypothetical protein [Helicobacter sp. T3_23-1056]
MEAESFDCHGYASGFSRNDKITIKYELKLSLLLYVGLKLVTKVFS